MQDLNKKDRDIVMVLQDTSKPQVMLESEAASVSVSGSVLVGALATTSGAHRLKMAKAVL